MKITGKLNADVVGITIKRNGSHDGQEAHLDLEVGVTQEQAEDRFGADFATLAFGTMRTIPASDEGGEDRVGFLVDSIRPGKNLVCEHHDVKLMVKRGNNGSAEESTVKVRCQPSIERIKPMDGEPKVTVRIRLPLEAADVAELVDQVGATIKAEFNPRQGELAFSAPKGNRAAEEAPATA